MCGENERETNIQIMYFYSYAIEYKFDGCTPINVLNGYRSTRFSAVGLLTPEIHRDFLRGIGQDV